MKSLPSGPWEVLFQRALRLVDDNQRQRELADTFWTFAGGSVLMFSYRHSGWSGSIKTRQSVVASDKHGRQNLAA